MYRKAESSIGAPESLLAPPPPAPSLLPRPLLPPPFSPLHAHTQKYLRADHFIYALSKCMAITRYVYLGNISGLDVIPLNTTKTCKQAFLFFFLNFILLLVAIIQGIG